MNLRFLGFIQIVMFLHALASIVVSCHLAIIGHLGFWVLMPFAGMTTFIQLRWKDIFKADILASLNEVQKKTVEHVARAMEEGSRISSWNDAIEANRRARKAAGLDP